MSSPELKAHLSNNGFLWGPEHHPYGVSGMMTYGPAGARVKAKLEAQFLDVFQREGFDQIETPVLMPTEAWEASGHLEEFGSEMFHTETSSGRQLAARPEIATTIYPLFSRLAQYNRGKMPFKVYQKGPSLPNDRQTEWQLRTRQYTAHEGHIFSEQHDAKPTVTISYLVGLASELMQRAGIAEDTLSFREKTDRDVPFYARSAYGLYTSQENGQTLELLGIQYRSTRDFERHSKATGVELKVNGAYPEVFEISFSSDRPFLVLLERSLRRVKERNGAVMQLPEHLAPLSAVVIPLDKSEAKLQQAEDINSILNKAGVDGRVFNHGSLGSRYKQADSIGVPYAITVDNDGIQDRSFTIRHRDTKQQVRVSHDDFKETVHSHVKDVLDGSAVVRRLFCLGSTQGNLCETNGRE